MRGNAIQFERYQESHPQKRERIYLLLGKDGVVIGLVGPEDNCEVGGCKKALARAGYSDKEFAIGQEVNLISAETMEMFIRNWGPDSRLGILRKAQEISRVQGLRLSAEADHPRFDQAGDRELATALWCLYLDGEHVGAALNEDCPEASFYPERVAQIGSFVICWHEEGAVTFRAFPSAEAAAERVEKIALKCRRGDSCPDSPDCAAPPACAPQQTDTSMSDHPLGHAPLPRLRSLAAVPLPAILLRWPEYNAVDSPWRLLAGCILRDGYSPEIVNRVWPEFFHRWPGVDECSRLAPSPGYGSVASQKQLLEAHGLPPQRVNAIRRLAQIWPGGFDGPFPHPNKAASLLGCDIPYARDAYLVFAFHCTEPDAVEDPTLRRWVEERVRYGWTAEQEARRIFEAPNLVLGIEPADLESERLNPGHVLDPVRCA